MLVNYSFTKDTLDSNQLKKTRIRTFKYATDALNGRNVEDFEGLLFLKAISIVDFSVSVRENGCGKF